MNSTEALRWIEPRIVLRAVVGSTVHGLHVGDATEDRDEMAVAFEPIEGAIGFSEFEQVVYRTAAIREHRHDARSMAGDLDLVVYSARKYLRLAIKGNPSILILLFVSDCMTRNATGAQLQELAPLIVSKKAGGAFLGYMNAQRQRLMGERGGKDVSRPELVEAHGYDTKYAMHMCRLGIQGIELMNTGRLTLPVAEPERSWLRDMRSGKVSEQEALTRAGELQRELKDAWQQSPLPDAPNVDAVERWMTERYLQHWKAWEPRAGLVEAAP